ncbi:MAG: Asp-tRNA(Asn)/Glu-tRNA(Gln) amidotransferase subunit GatB [Patescibacteria group bacterium]
MPNLNPIIGMELHIELKTASKMFCGCKNDPFFAPKPNIYTCPVCLGMPGGLPVANKTAIEWTMKLGLALGSTIALFSKFDRKHYFYPDLAKGYQISQYDQPLCTGGVVHTEFGDVRIRRIHLEEDTGKLQHTTINGKKVSLIDFNRCGVPLVEIVTEPDIHSSEQAKAFAKKIQQIVRTLEISSADMEKGSMRLEANISLSTDPKVLPTYKVEAKNINSFRFLDQAIHFEIDRQTASIKAGKTPRQETRGWNEAKHETTVQRVKEDAEDYRYFPDPDLPPMQFTQKEIEDLRAQLPELPDQQMERYLALGIKKEFALILSSADHNTKTVDEALALVKTAKIEANVIATVIVNKKINTFTIKPVDIVKTAKETYSYDEVSEDEIQKTVQKILTEQPKAVADYKAGKTQVMGFLLGMVMKRLKKKLDPHIIQQELLKLVA